MNKCPHTKATIIVTEAFDIHEVTETRCCECGALLPENNFLELLRNNLLKYYKKPKRIKL